MHHQRFRVNRGAASRGQRVRLAIWLAAAAGGLGAAGFAGADPVSSVFVPNLANNPNYNWEDPTNWLNGVAPGVASPGHTGVDDVAAFTAPTNTIIDNVTLTNVPVTLGELDLDKAANLPQGYRISGSNVLTFEASSGTAAIHVTATNSIGTHILQVGGIVLNSDLAVDVAANSQLQLYGVISDDGAARSITFSGAGTTTLFSSYPVNQPNTYGGVTRVTGGTLALSSFPSVPVVPGALIIGTPEGAAATVRLTSAEQIADSAAVTVHPGATFDLNGNGQTVGSLTGGGNVFLSNNTSNGSGLTVAGSTDSTFAGTFTGIGKVHKTGASTFTVTGNNTFHGGFVLSGGTLAVGSATAVGPDQVTFSDTTGGATLTSVAGPLTVTNSVHIDQYASFGGTSAMSFGQLDLSTGTAQITTSVDTSFNGPLIGFANATKTGPATLTINVAPNTQAQPGNFTGAWTVNGGTLRVLNPSAATDWTTQYTVNNATLDLTGAGPLNARLSSVNGTILGDLTLYGNVTGTNLTLGNLTLANVGNNLSGTLTIGSLTVAGLHTIAAGSTIGGDGGVTVQPLGNLIVQGTLNKSLSVAGELSGGGVIGGPVTLTGTGAAAPLIAKMFPSRGLRTGSLTMGANSQFNATLAGTFVTTVDVTGSVEIDGDLGAGLSVPSPNLATTPVNTSFVLIDNDGTDAVVGHFAGLANDGDTIVAGANYQLAINYHYDADGDGTNNDVALTYLGAAPTPEPTAAAGAIACGASAFLTRRRRRN